MSPIIPRGGRFSHYINNCKTFTIYKLLLVNILCILKYVKNVFHGKQLKGFPQEKLSILRI